MKLFGIQKNKKTSGKKSSFHTTRPKAVKNYSSCDKNLGVFLSCYIAMSPKNLETYSEPSQTSKMELLAKIIHGGKPLTIFAKNAIVDV